jgi:hypothetical protein
MQPQLPTYNDIESATDFFAFGMPMPDRTFSIGEYRYGFNGMEKDNQIQGEGTLYTALFWEYDTRLGKRWNIDPIIKPWESGYSCFSNNSILFTDPNGQDIDVSKIMKSPEHAKAFVLFAQTKEGKAFLKDYASKGQKLEYDGKVFFEATDAGKYDKQNVNLVYNVGNSDMGSGTSGSWGKLSENKKDFVYDINIDIAKIGFGSNNKTFNLVKAITHESFMHANSTADDHLDDNYQNNSNLPSEYRQYGTHADHYYICREYFKNPNNNTLQLFPVNSFSVLKQVSKTLNLNYSDIKIKSIIWNFSGSLLNVNSKTGLLEYKK